MSLRPTVPSTAVGPILPDWARSARQQHRFGVGEVFGLAVDDDNIAIAQDGIPGRLTAHDPLPAYACERHDRAPAAYVIQGAADRPRARRDDDRDHLLLLIR